MELLLGIDIGTSACKITVFHTDGTPAASVSASYPVYRPQSGWAEQRPENWWAAVMKNLPPLLADNRIKPTDIAGVGIASQSWTAVWLGRDGNVLTPAPLWMDTRSADICSRIRMEAGEAALFQVSGNPLQPFYTTGKLLWLKEQRQECYRKAEVLMQPNGYLAYCLTGAVSQDFSQGYSLHCFDVRKNIWDEDLCRTLGIRPSLLPDLVRSDQIVGHVTDEAARLTGLAPGTPVVAGGLDAACGTLGAGVIHAGEAQEQGGQAGGMSICMDECRMDPGLILGRHVVPGKWLLQGGTTGGGGVMRWLEQEFGDYERMAALNGGPSSLEQLNLIAGQVSPGSDGLIFLPYMAGERSPIWDEKAKGVFYGIDFSKTKGHFIRAGMEGVGYALLHNLDTARAAGARPEQLRAVGGAANSRLWTQIKADITGCEIAVPSSDSATALGAAMLAGVGTGVYRDYQDAVRQTVKISRIHHPDPESHRQYRQYYRTYLELYRNLKDMMGIAEQQ